MAETKRMKQYDTNTTKDTKAGPSSSKDLSYLNRLPSIAPNYGRKHYSVCYILKSKISRVLLYDNITQQRMLDRKLNLLGGEQRRVMQLLDYHRKSFENQKNLKHKRLAFHTRLPVTQIEETQRVQPEVMTEVYQQQRLPEILSGCSSFTCTLNPSVSSQNSTKYSSVSHEKESPACSQAHSDQMTKSDGSTTRNVDKSNGDNNNLADGAPVLTSCKSQNTTKYSSVSHEKESPACSQAHSEQITKSDGDNNNFDDSAPVLTSCKSQAKGVKINFSNHDYDVRFVSLEQILSPMDKNSSRHVKCQVTFPMKTKDS